MQVAFMRPLRSSYNCGSGLPKPNAEKKTTIHPGMLKTQRTTPAKATKLNLATATRSIR